MKYIAIALSEVGKIRKNNEDNLFFDGEFRRTDESGNAFRKTLTSQEPIKLFALCDGMGGEVMGEQASYMAVSGLKEIERHFMQDQGKSFPKLMPRYLARVNESLCQMIRNNKGRRMGSTFASLILRGNVAQTLNIGDSRIYLFRNGKLSQLSVDHTYAQRLVEMGIITQAEAAQHPERNRLSQHLGLFPEEVQIQPALSPEIWLQAGDSFLICTDGVTEMLSEASITDILRSPQAFLQQAENLMQRALAAGGKDNISLILLKIQELDDEGEQDKDDALLPAVAALAAADGLGGGSSYQEIGDSEKAAVPSTTAVVSATTAAAAASASASAVTNAAPAAAASPAAASPFPVPAVASPAKPAVNTDSAYQLSEDELARFEAARLAALERQQELKAQTAPQAGLVSRITNGKAGQAMQKAGATRVGDDPHKRKLRGPSTAYIIGRAVLFFLICVVLGFALIFAAMNIGGIIRIINQILGR